MKNNLRLITITPKEAKKLLELNVNNRRVKPDRVRIYAEEMKHNRWQINGECIKISEGNIILDGQHRLLACVAADVSFVTYIMTELPDSIMPTIDQGVARTPSDIMGLYGIKNSTGVAATIKKYIWIKSGLSNVERKVSVAILLEEYNKRPDFWQSVFSFSRSISTANNGVILMTSIGAYYAWLLEYGDAGLFFELMVSSDKTPSNVFIKYMTRAKLTKRKVNQSEFHYLIIKSFNAFKSGKEISLLSLRPNETMPELIK